MLFTICLFAYTAIKCFALVSLKRKFVSRIDWIQLGESNTKFFHSFAKRRRNQNAIKLLIKEDGSRCCTQQQIKDEVVSFYQNLMGHAADRIPMVDKYVISRGSIPNTQQQQNLMLPFTAAEIKSALFGMDSQNSPGMDGFNVS